MLLVTQAIAQNRPNLPLIVAANKGQTEAVEQLIHAKRGTVLRTIPEIGYIYAIFPTSEVWWLESQPSVADLTVAGDAKYSENLRSAAEPDVKEDIPEAKLREKVEEEQSEKLRELQKATGKSLGKVDLSLPLLPPELLATQPGLNANAYLGQPEWLRAHPGWDGRGIAILSNEGLPNLGHPALQEAKDLQGNSTRKIIGIINATDFKNRNPGAYYAARDVKNWGGVNFQPRPQLKDGKRCPAPENSTQQVGVWDTYYGEFGAQFCVEWSPAKRIARIDLNKDGHFDDDSPLGDFNETRAFLKIPYTAKVDDGQPEHYFDVYLLYDQQTGAITILPTDDHTTMTATAAAGTGYMGTSIGGMAPASRLLFFWGFRLNEVIEGFWQAASRPDIDLITNSSAIGGDDFPNDGSTVAMMFMDRIMGATGKPIVSMAGNHGLPFEQGYGRSRLMTDVGGYISDQQLELFRHNTHTIHLPGKEFVFDESGSGPSPDGSFSTDILTPELGITGADCGSDHYTGTAEMGQIGFRYRLPACYSLGGGTSTATPRAAGAVALLLSAARQQRLKVTPARVKNALTVSARYLPGQPAFRQGSGILQVGEAWNALVEAASKPPFSIVSSTSDLSPLYPQFWVRPLLGKSIYVTRGFHPGDRKQLQMQLAVSGLDAASLSFNLLGNDGTFEITSNQADNEHQVTVFLSAHADSIGNKSAIMEVHARGWKYPVARFPILLVATPSPEELRKGISLQGKYDMISSDFFVFEPPQGTAAVEIDAEATGDDLDVGFVTSSNAALTFEPAHGVEWATSILNSHRKYILPLQHADIVGMKISNDRFSYIPDQPTQFKFTVRALTRQDMLATVVRKDFTLQVIRQRELQTYSIPRTPLREVNVVVPPQGVDSLVVTFPKPNADQVTLFATQVYAFTPPYRGRERLWNHYPVISPNTLLAIPKPAAGNWKFIISGPDPGPVTVQLLRATRQNANTRDRGYLAFGSQCRGTGCADTWPLDDPLWRFMPLFPIDSPVNEQH